MSGHADPELVCGAVAAVLRIDHVFVEPRLPEIWALIGAHHHEPFARDLATAIIVAYLDLRQIDVAFASAVNVPLRRLVDPSLLLRIPTPQLAPIVDRLLADLDDNAVTRADLLIAVLDVMRERIPDNYDDVVSALNGCLAMPLNERLAVYAATRRVRARSDRTVLLPDQIAARPFDFLADMDHVPHDLLHVYDRLTPGIIDAVVQCLNESDERRAPDLFGIWPDRYRPIPGGSSPIMCHCSCGSRRPMPRRRVRPTSSYVMIFICLCGIRPCLKSVRCALRLFPIWHDQFVHSRSWPTSWCNFLPPT